MQVHSVEIPFSEITSKLNSFVYKAFSQSIVEHVPVLNEFKITNNDSPMHGLANFKNQTIFIKYKSINGASSEISVQHEYSRNFLIKQDEEDEASKEVERTISIKLLTFLSNDQDFDQNDILIESNKGVNLNVITWFLLGLIFIAILAFKEGC